MWRDVRYFSTKEEEELIMLLRFIGCTILSLAVLAAAAFWYVGTSGTEEVHEIAASASQNAPVPTSVIREQFRLAVAKQPVSMLIICDRLRGLSRAAAGLELGVMLEGSSPLSLSEQTRWASIWQEECK